MEKTPDDRCTRTKVAASGDAGKTAAGISVYLIEELGDARLRCAQLKKYVADAQLLIENSSHRDHFFEVAAHLIEGIPDTLFRLEKALDAAAMSAARMDYEEIKQNLKPQKAEELETVLQDARVRYLQRRSGAVSNGKDAAEEIRRIAAVADATGCVPIEDVMVLLSTLERGARTAGTKMGASERLREMAAHVEARTNPSRIEIANDIRRFLAESVQPTASQTAVALMQQATSRAEVMKKFKESNPDLTEAQLETVGDEWEKNKSVVKDKTASDDPQETANAAKAIVSTLAHMDAEWRKVEPSRHALLKGTTHHPNGRRIGFALGQVSEGIYYLTDYLKKAFSDHWKKSAEQADEGEVNKRADVVAQLKELADTVSTHCR